MNVDNFSNNKDPVIKSNKQDPIVNNSKSHVEILIEKICSDSSLSAQAQMAARVFKMFTAMTNIAEKLSLVRGELGLAAIEAGFKSADETAKAGLLQLGGGMIFAGAGVAQGVAGCTKATELAQATEAFDTKVAEIEQNIMQEVLPTEGSDIIVQVEALDEPITSGLDEIEEEIFYDAEESLSCKQTKPEEQTEAQKIVEKATVQNKITEEKANKLIDKENKKYDVKKNLIDTKSKKIQGLAAPGQALYFVSQGLGDVEKSKAQKENLQKEVTQDNQNQIGNTAEDLKRKADKIAEFDPYRSNSASFKG